MPHIIEEAKSGRAGCRTCRKPIPKGELRFGEEVENQFADAGEMTYRWHHIRCAAGAKSDELRATLANPPEGTPPIDDAFKAELEQVMSEADAKKPPPFPHADKAPTGRAGCQGCGEKIAKGELRVAFEREIERGMQTTKGAGYLHPRCAAAYMEQQGTSHDALTDALHKNTRDLSGAELDRLFSEV
jgi:poly [ADP-ribose] polymerase